jgi:hypothetical protein
MRYTIEERKLESKPAFLLTPEFFCKTHNSKLMKLESKPIV